MSIWKGAVFGLHAVVSGTTGLHFEAWKHTFDEFLSKLDDGFRYRPFDFESDYLECAYGRPRYKAAATFLRSRDIHVPHGHPSDPSSRQTVCGIANAKNERFRMLLAERGIQRIPNAAELLSDLRSRGIRTAVVSSSRNCHDVLAAAGLAEAFDTVIDGNDLVELGLPPMEEPDAFLLATDNLLVLPGECMLAVATPEGVHAGHRGNFGFLVGVSRDTDPETMLENGADLALDSLEAVSFERVTKWFDQEREQDSWALTYHGFRPDEEMLRESLTTVGNGYIGSRGAFCGADMFPDIHYPGTYVAGLWNTVGTDVHGRTIRNSDFVNIPNWLLVELRIGSGSCCRILGAREVEQYVHTLDMKRAVTRRSFCLRDPKGYLTRIETLRFVSMAEPHLAMLEYRLTPLNYSETVVLKSTIDGTVINYGVPRYRGLSKRHLEGGRTWEEDGRIALHARTSESG
ncbi:MAG: beta-phosphoglucomutase, partial [Spirochaetaceae bacterium]